jgi:alpha-L-fucosidase
MGDGELVMNNQQIPVKTYEKLPGFLNPTAFDAKAWDRWQKMPG